MMKLLSLFLLLAILYSADAAKFRRLRGENSVNNKYLDLASEVDETVRQRNRQLMGGGKKKDGKNESSSSKDPAPVPDVSPPTPATGTVPDGADAPLPGRAPEFSATSMSFSMSMSMSMSMPMSRSEIVPKQEIAPETASDMSMSMSMSMGMSMSM
jgi:hypothetical protein